MQTNKIIKAAADGSGGLRRVVADGDRHLKPRVNSKESEKCLN